MCDSLGELNKVILGVSKMNVGLIAGGVAVNTVLIDGRVALDAQRPTRIDPSTVFDAVQASVKRIFDRMGYRFEAKWVPLDQSQRRLNR